MERDIAFVRLAGVLSSRAAALYGVEPSPSSVAALLVEAGLQPRVAEDVAWGRPAPVSVEESPAVARTFDLNEALLGCVLRPMSFDGLEHMLLHGIRSDLCEHDCPVCDRVVERAYALPDDPDGDVLSLIVDALEHLRSRPAPRRVDDGLLDEGRFVEVLRALPEASRLRVLAFAFDELNTVTSGRPIGEFAAYARLRGDYLEAKTCRLLDALALAPEGELSAAEIASGLGLDGRAVAQILRSLSRSLRDLARDGNHLSEEPLELRETRPRDRRLRLRPRALAAWRSLLRAESETAHAA